MRATRLLLPSLVCLVASGCDACNGSHPVPFRQDTGAAVPAPIEPSTPSAFEPVEGTQTADGTHEVSVEGAPLRVERADVRVLVPFDADGDGDRDAALVTRSEQKLELVFATRQGASFELAARGLELTTAPAGCTFGALSARAIARSMVAVQVETVCPQAVPTDPPIFDARTRTVLAALATPPRRLESFGLERADGEAAAGLSLRAADQDGDGHDDVLAELSVTLPGESDATVAVLPFFDRPSGLARDAHEPEATLARLATEARQALRRDPARAGRLAARVLALHRVICRESGAARLRIGDAVGVACRASGAAGTAQAIRTQALAREGNVLEALAAYATLSSTSLTVSTQERDQSKRALGQMRAVTELDWWDGPPLTDRPGPDARLPMLALVDGNLVVRGEAPTSQPIGEGEPAPTSPALGDVLLRDPGGVFALVDLHRTCDGTALGIVNVANVLSGVVTGGYVSEPRVELRPAPNTPCPPVLEAARFDPNGWVVLGWAPQGAVVARGEEVRVVPLAADGTSLGDAQRLAPGTPLPAPLPAGAATTDGRAYALATPFGILVRLVSPESRTELWRAAGWPAEALGVQTPTELAVSTDASRVAFVLGGRVRVMTRRGAATP